MKQLESEEKEALIRAYLSKNEEVKAQVCIETFLDYLNANKYLNTSKIRIDL